jgi:hypothetical protein
LAAALAAGVVLPGCESNLRPLRPLQRVEVWVPDETAAATPATAPATLPADAIATTEPATQPALAAAATQPGGETGEVPATQPGRMVVKVIDPNQTSRFIYKATYDNIWQQAIDILTRTGFALDRQDYRLGVLTTRPLPSAQILEFWKPQHADATTALENTINNQRRIVRLSITKVPGKPDFYEVGVQVLVERKTNPTEQIGGPLFVEGSGFGRNAITLRSDFAEVSSGPGIWLPIGHDPKLEGKLITELFNRI